MLTFEKSRSSTLAKLVYSLGYFIAVQCFQTDILCAQQAVTTSMRTDHRNPSSVRWIHSTAEGAALAKKTRKPILLFVRSDNCHHCDRMEVSNWKDPRIATWVNQHFVPVQLTSRRNASEIEQLKIKGYPTTFVYSSDLRFLQRIDGYVGPDALVKSVLDATRRPQSK